MKSIHTRVPDGLRGVLLAKPQRRGSSLEVEGFQRSALPVSKHVRGSVPDREASFRDYAVETGMLEILAAQKIIWKQPHDLPKEGGRIV